VILRGRIMEMARDCLHQLATDFAQGVFMMRVAQLAVLLGSTLALGACAAGPTPVVGLPGPNKDIATFQKEDAACRQEAGQAVHPASAAAPVSGNTNDQWQVFFSHYAQCETAHGNVVEPAPWATAYADYLGYGVPPYAYAGYGYPYAYAGYPYFYGSPFLYGYPYPFFFGVGYGFGYGHIGGYGHFGGGFGHGGGGHR